MCISSVNTTHICLCTYIYWIHGWCSNGAFLPQVKVVQLKPSTRQEATKEMPLGEQSWACNQQQGGKYKNIEQGRSILIPPAIFDGWSLAVKVAAAHYSGSTTITGKNGWIHARLARMLKNTMDHCLKKCGSGELWHVDNRVHGSCPKGPCKELFQSPSKEHERNLPLTRVQLRGAKVVC